MDTLINFLGLGNVFATLAGMGIAIMVLEELIDRLWNLDGVASQIRTLIFGAVLGLAGALLNLGMFTDPYCCGELSDWICGPVVGFAAAVGANVVFLLPLSKAILELLKIRPKE